MRINQYNERDRVHKILMETLGVSRETCSRIDRFVDELTAWQKHINLISPTTIETIWDRHILDCAQLLKCVSSQGKVWVDLGSGAGLPGVVIACLMAEIDEEFHIHLIESNSKKASFLRHISGMLNLPTTVYNDRIERVLPILPKIDVVTARAVASLDDLLRLSNFLLKKGAIALFPKGRDVEEELTFAAKNWLFSYSLLPSLTDSTARIVCIDRWIE